jgi:hypothetical protein
VKPATSLLAKSAAIQRARLEQTIADLGFSRPGSIPDWMGFREWCETLGTKGLKVDNLPFTLANRRALHEVYDSIPRTIEEAFGRTLVIQKGSQMGLTLFEILADIYMALKFAPCKVLMYLPDRSMAAYKSAERFMPIARSIPEVHALITGGAAAEGNKLTRTMPALGSGFLFLWTRGREGGVSESFPGDVLSLDETQGMTLEQIDRVSERLSASRIKFRLMLSTPLWPEMDINAWWRAGDQRKFHTACDCPEGVVLTDVFHAAALSNSGKIPVVYNDGRFPGAPDDFVYYCPECGCHIPDPQEGEWRAHNPGSKIKSYHLSQILSPTVTPREMLEAWGRADTADRRQNFFCRKLGTPFADPSQVPVSMEILRQCAEEGMRLGLTWKQRANHTIAGIDQMGGFAVCTVAERLADGRMAIIHVEAIYALDPWARLDEIMRDYGVQICVLEQLPNIDSARQFAKRHEGRVFLITSYGDMEEMVRWNDVVVSKSDRRTAAEYRDRYTLQADQYRILSWAFARLAERYIVFPDPMGLVQEVREGGVGRPAPILKDMTWLHYTKTGLVLEEDEEQRKTRRKVIKLGLDPHFSFSLLALCAGWFRAHGTGTIILPSAEPPGLEAVRAQRLAEALPGLPTGLIDVMVSSPPGTCGRCSSFEPQGMGGRCRERGYQTAPRELACQLFIARRG